MEAKKLVKAGDLVTLSLGTHSQHSNTYKVERKVKGEVVLSHPLAPECLILRKDEDLNQAFPALQSTIEKCLIYAKKHKEYLGYNISADLESMCFYFVIKKDLTTKQKNELYNMCGKISATILSNSIHSAISYIKDNKALLDDFNVTLLNNYRNIIENPGEIKSKNERFTIFNMAGFILAQLS
jgi:hypothetical protein